MNAETPRPLLSRMRPGMGTFIEIGCADGTAAAVAVDDAYRAIADVEHSLSFQNPESELSRLNAAKGKPLQMSALAVRVLRLAVAMGKASAGRFNCTVGRALVERGVLPDHGFGDGVTVGTPTHIAISGRSVALRDGVLVTLDGIAKGYAIDAAVQVLMRRGIAWGWVNAGGDLRAFGDVVVPVYRRERDRMVSLGAICDGAVATSGAFTDEAPGLIVDPLTSQPTGGTWTIIARKAWRADALTKVAACVDDASRGDVLASLGGRELS